MSEEDQIHYRRQAALFKQVLLTKLEFCSMISEKVWFQCSMISTISHNKGYRFVSLSLSPRMRPEELLPVCIEDINLNGPIIRFGKIKSVADSNGWLLSSSVPKWWQCTPGVLRRRWDCHMPILCPAGSHETPGKKGKGLPTSLALSFFYYSTIYRYIMSVCLPHMAPPLLVTTCPTELSETQSFAPGRVRNHVENKVVERASGGRIWGGGHLEKEH